MRKLTIILLLLLSITSHCFAQEIKLNKDTSGFANSALYLLKISGNEKTFPTIQALGLIEQKDIASMEILKDKTADQLYGEKGKNGVIIITLTATSKLFTLPQLLDKYKVTQNYQGLPLYLDYNLIASAANKVFTLGKIKSVTIDKYKETSERYICLISTDYPNMAVPDAYRHTRGESIIKP